MQRALLLLLILSACTPSPSDEDIPPPVDPARIQTLTLERSYTLRDAREAEFLQEIRGAAKDACGGAHSILATRPIGSEIVAEEGLYRMYEIDIACQG